VLEDIMQHDPIAKVLRWLDLARRRGIPEYQAMALATVRDDAGQPTPSVRFVMLRQLNEDGFVFFTDRRSRKGLELNRNSRAALALYWQPLGRQVRSEGRVEEISSAEADAYWTSRGRSRQLAASASHQSQPLRSRDDLLAKFRALAAKFPSGVPRSEYWTGFRLRPLAIEFWKQGRYQLHERERFTRNRKGWRQQLLQP
jgi:pyridoxamine 5'-phosphate oxidase